MTTTHYKQEEIKEHGIDNLDSIQADSVYGADLHHELYNMDYFIIGTYQAKEFMGSNAFDIIGIVQEYEQDNFGEVSTDLSDPEKVVNMYAYIVGEEILSESDALRNAWDRLLTQEDLDVIKEDLS